MTEILVVGVTSLLLIAAAAVVGPRLRIAAPLVLVAVGVGASYLPVFKDLEIDPEWILEGLLPPLLYSSAVSMPSMHFRREFGAISGLSVVLVIATSLILGLFFTLVIPDLGFAWGVALGAIISPTDAVAMSIIKQTSVSRRVVAILEGESLLNDAMALVILRTAIVATVATFSVWVSMAHFAYSVIVAVLIGLFVGWLNLAVRKRVTDPTVNTVISFAVPFVASLPASLLDASGLVAAVVAGLATGFSAPRLLSPQNRVSDSQNWRTVELMLEGIVFLTMGLQIQSIVTSVENEHEGVIAALPIAAIALLLTVLVRAAYVAPLLGVLSRSARRSELRHERMLDIQEQMRTPEGKKQILQEANSGWLSRSERQIEGLARRVTQSIADIEYFRRTPLGWREGTIVVWAGMRGAVTVAAAQTLPIYAPERPVLILLAFSVALMSLVLQGSTIGLLLRLVMPKVDQQAVDAQTEDERTRLIALMRTSAEAVPKPLGADGRLLEMQYHLTVLAAQRAALLDARDNGIFDADVLGHALANLDASQIAIAMREQPS